MATFTFDGTSSITATKNDTVLISADVQSFTQATDNGSSVSLAFGANTLTITGTTLVSGGLPNVFVTGGTFSYASAAGVASNTNGAGTGNVLSILNNTDFTLQTTAASSKVAIFGGLGRIDNLDGNDTIHIGGKGSQLVFGNAGNDTIDQLSGAAGAGVAFDSTSIVNVSGDLGDDSINLNIATNSKASIFVGAGAGADSINIVNTGVTTIQGGLDSNDGNDTIVFNGVAGAGGTSQIFGNGGNDTITVGTAGANALDSTTTTTIYGGFGNDGITVTGTKATISVIGGEGTDTITVTNSGNTFITGGNQSGDQSLDANDTISFTGAGTALVYGNAGADGITAAVGNINGLTDTTNISIYGGKDADTITQTIVATTTGKATVFIAGGEGGDIITANGNGGAVTIYGGISNADATDGADTINYGTTVGATASTGAANIFANGGNDTVNIGTLGNDSTNTVTVYGGGGNDSINVGVQNSTFSANAQQLVINGNDGSDSITIAHSTTAAPVAPAVVGVTTTALGQTITINDFALGTTGDALKITGVTGAAGTTVAATGGSFATLQDALNAAAAAGKGANLVGAVAFGGSTYIVVDTDSSGTYTATADQAIKLTGVTDVFSVASQTVVSAT